MLKWLSSLVILVMVCSPAWGATQLKKTVCPSGCDYTSLEACMNANEQNLVTADKYFDVEISGTWSSADTTAVTIHNYTTDATRYINIYTVGDARHDGTAYKSGAYVLQTTGLAINIATFSYSILDGIVIDVNGQAVGAINQASDIVDFTYKNLIAYNGTGLSYTIGIRAGASGKIINPILFDVRRGIYCISDNANVTIYNATILAGSSASYGILNLTAVNSYVGGFGTEDFYSLPATGSNYNVSSDNSADDEAAVYALGKTSYSDYFVSTTSGAEDYHLKSDTNTLWGLSGTNLSATFTTDIDGQTRTAPWDIGADEYVATSTGRPVSTQFVIHGGRGSLNLR